MILGPKYKIARRLNAPIFEKTQTQKFALSLARKTKDGAKRPKQKTNFGRQLNEKQKARFTYGINERQFGNYVKAVLAKKGINQAEVLVQALESRLDNVIYRMGLASTRRFARQIVAHGHIMHNGRRVTVPSIVVSVGDSIKIRPGSAATKLFAPVAEKMKTYTMPAWVQFDMEKKEGSMVGLPKVAPAELLFDAKTVLEFYNSR